MNLKYLKHLAKRSAPYIHPKGHEATQILIDNLKILDGERILELGCGTGATLCEIAYKYDVKIEGIDVLEEMVSSANERIYYLGLQQNGKVKLCSSGKPYPYDEGTFDKVYAESVLGFQEINQIEFLLKEIYRVLKPRGLFVMNEALWSENTDPILIEEICKKANESFGLGPASPSKITESVFSKMAEDSGFDLLKVIELTNLKDSKQTKTQDFMKLQKKFNRKKNIKNFKSFAYLIDEIQFRKNISNQSEYRSYLYSYLFIFIK